MAPTRCAPNARTKMLARAPVLWRPVDAHVWVDARHAGQHALLLARVERVRIVIHPWQLFPGRAYTCHRFAASENRSWDTCREWRGLPRRSERERERAKRRRTHERESRSRFQGFWSAWRAPKGNSFALALVVPTFSTLIRIPNEHQPHDGDNRRQAVREGPARRRRGHGRGRRSARCQNHGCALAPRMPSFRRPSGEAHDFPTVPNCRKPRIVVFNQRRRPRTHSLALDITLSICMHCTPHMCVSLPYIPDPPTAPQNK